MKSVLYTLVGSTDPIRDNYDGAMMHITRNYSPSKVYIFITTQMKERDLLDNRYEKSIHSIDKNIEVVKLYKDITEAHLFESYYDLIDDDIKNIRKENDDDTTILVNITSGPPQFVASMALYISSVGGDIKPIQVSTPKRAANDSEVVKKDYDLETQIEMNIDNEKNSKRCIEPNLLHFQKAIISSELKSLVENYEYSSAKRILGVNKAIFSNYSKIMSLLNFAEAKMDLDLDRANNFLTDSVTREKLILNVKNKDYIELQTYFILLKLKLDKKDYNSVLLMLDPLFTELQISYIKKMLKLNVSDYISGKYTNYHTIATKYPTLLEFLKASWLEGSGYELDTNREMFVSYRYLLDIIKYYVEEKNLDFSDYEVFEKYDNLKESRNKVAHNLAVKNKNEIEVALGQGIDIFINATKKIIIKVFDSVAQEKHFNAFDIANDLILEELV